MATIEEAKAAKEKFPEAWVNHPEFNGIGIGIDRKTGGYTVHVLFKNEVPADLPKSIEGVPVTHRVTGEIQAY